MLDFSYIQPFLPSAEPRPRNASWLPRAQVLLEVGGVIYWDLEVSKDDPRGAGL